MAVKLWSLTIKKEQILRVLKTGGSGRSPYIRQNKWQEETK